MPLPTSAEITDPTATNTQMKQRLGQLADGVESKEDSNLKNQQTKNFAETKVNNLASAITLKKADDPSIINIVNDSIGNSMVYIDRETGIFNAAGLKSSIYNPINQLKLYSSSDYAAPVLDANGNVLYGVNKHTHKFEAVGLDFSNQKQKNHKYFKQKPFSADINHILSYGESLSVGAAATTILSTVQPYFNITFDTGPKMNGLSATALKPLVEDFTSPAPDGGTNRGETHCSGTANFASLSLLKKGINPDQHVIFASTAGYGGAKISQLTKTTSVYLRLLAHINKARELNPGKTHKVLFVPFIVGTNDAFYETTYEDFKTVFLDVYSDLNADIKR